MKMIIKEEFMEKIEERIVNLETQVRNLETEIENLETENEELNKELVKGMSVVAAVAELQEELRRYNSDVILIHSVRAPMGA